MRPPSRPLRRMSMGYITMTPGRIDDQAGDCLTEDAANALYALRGHTHPASGGDLTYTHTQLAPAAEWTIAHGLAKHPAVTVVDSGGNWLIGDIQYLDANTVKVTFSAAFAGVAYLN